LRAHPAAGGPLADRRPSREASPRPDCAPSGMGTHGQHHLERGGGFCRRAALPEGHAVRAGYLCTPLVSSNLHDRQIVCRFAGDRSRAPRSAPHIREAGVHGTVQTGANTALVRACIAGHDGDLPGMQTGPCRRAL
jgi:hypothetical protein